ncbi:metallophosphoesterase family protein [Ghiorsea bivora]|uniref:metallophosphoesterase family protein n=1 Tax=Ghiorsea bivora TaxID=1485545 RepID=UPI00068D05A2|nr:metallophosphoesterase family protein [Ghiorsea bivora]
MTHFTFVGDPHGLIEHILTDIQQKPASATILLGDICIEQPIDQVFDEVKHLTALYWIHGNHDTDNDVWFNNLFKSPWASRNLHARTLKNHQTTIAGLGGVFRAKVWNPSQEKRYASKEAWEKEHQHKRFAQSFPSAKRKHHSTIWPEDYEHLSQLSADILVLHEAPSSHRHGQQALDDLAEKLGVRLIIHGHHHYEYTDTLANGIAVVGLALGQIAHLNIDLFTAASNNNDILNAFTFGTTVRENLAYND